MFGQQNKSTGFASSQQQTSRFGQLQQQQPFTSGFFGSTSNSQQNRTGSNVSTLNLQTGSFGRQQAQPQPQGFLSVQSNSSASVVGQPSTVGGSDTAQTGTVIKFTPTTGTDVIQKGCVATWIDTKHHCITCMKEYEDKSLEELRYEDYLAKRKGSHKQTGVKTTPFGTAASYTPSLFRQAEDKPAFGQTTALGQRRSTFEQPITGFGHQNQRNTSLFAKSTPGFGTLASGASTSSFGTNTNVATFGATQQSKPKQSEAQPQGSSVSKFNSSASVVKQSSTIGSPDRAQTGTVIKFTPITGTVVVQKGSITTWINTKHHCITCMKEYEDKSLEELRYEDYLAKRKGSHQLTGFKTAPFGTTASSAPSLFRQADKPAFGQITAFHQTQSTFGQLVTGIGHQNQENTSLFAKSTPGFGTLSSGASTSSFGTNTNVATSFGATQQSKPKQSEAQPQGSSLSKFNRSASVVKQSSTIGSPDTAQTGTVIKFTPITGTVVVQKGNVTTWINTKHHCITCMKEYEDKSLEELRYEDYLAKRKGSHEQTGVRTTPFGTTASFAPSLFRQADDKPAFGQTTAFSQRRSTFGQPINGFGHQNLQNTSLFGKSTMGFGTLASGANTSSFGTNTNVATSFGATQQSKPKQYAAQPQGSSLSKFNSSGSVVKQSSPDGAQTGTVIKFTPITGTDVVQKGSVTTWLNTKHHSITCMKEYEGKSFEELRYEDYLAKRKGSHQLTGFKATPFGTTASSVPSLFRQADKSAIGQTAAFDQTQSTFGKLVTVFGHQNQQNTGFFGKPTTGFGTLAASTSSFGTNTNVSSSSLCQSTGSTSIFGQSSRDIAQSGTAIKFTPIIGTDTVQKGAVATSINTKHHCITCMREYEGKSLEELRYEDYLAGRGNLLWKSQTGFATTHRKKSIATSLRQRRHSRGPSAKGSDHQNNDRKSFGIPPSPLTLLSGGSSLEQSVIGADFQDKKNSDARFSSRPFSANFNLHSQPKNSNFCSLVSPFGQTLSSFGLCGISSGLQKQQNVDSDSPTPFSEQKQSSTGSTCHNQRKNADNSRRALPSSYLFGNCGEEVDFVQARSSCGDSNSKPNLHAQLSKDDSPQNVDSDPLTTPSSDCHNQLNNGGNSSRTLPSSYLFDDKSCKPPPSLAASIFEKSSDKTTIEQIQPSGKISTDPDLQNEQKVCGSSSTHVPSVSHLLSSSKDNSAVGQTKVFEKIQPSSEQSSFPVPSVPLLFDSSKGESLLGHTKESEEIKPSSEKEHNSGNDSCTIPESSVSPLSGCTNDESLSQRTQFSSDLPVDSNAKKQETTGTNSSESSLCDQKEDKIVSDQTVGSEQMQSLLEQFHASLNLQNR